MIFTSILVEKFESGFLEWYLREIFRENLYEVFPCGFSAESGGKKPILGCIV